MDRFAPIPLPEVTTQCSGQVPKRGGFGRPFQRVLRIRIGHTAHRSTLVNNSLARYGSSTSLRDRNCVCESGDLDSETKQTIQTYRQFRVPMYSRRQKYYRLTHCTVLHREQRYSYTRECWVYKICIIFLPTEVLFFPLPTVLIGLTTNIIERNLPAKICTFFSLIIHEARR